MDRTCAYQYPPDIGGWRGTCRIYVTGDDLYCWQHDPAKARARKALARKQARTRRPQGLGPPAPREMQRVKQWFLAGGGAEAFDEFAR